MLVENKTRIYFTYLTSVAEPEPKPPGATTFRVEPEPEPLYFKAAPSSAASVWQAKMESLVVVTKYDLRAIYNGKCDPKRLALIISK